MRVQGPDLGMPTSPLKTTPLRQRNPQRRHPQSLRLPRQSLRLPRLRLLTPDTTLFLLTPSNGGHLAVPAIGMSGDCPC